MKKIESFKSFSQLQNQIREEARLKEVASKRDATVSEFNALLQKYNAASVADLNEEDRDAFMAELTKEGNAFGAARAEAIAKGEEEFKVGDEEMPVKNVDKEDEENAEEFVKESTTIIEEGTRGQFGKIYKNGEIASVYTHYDSYPENMIPLIRNGYKKGTDVDAVLGKGGNSGLEDNIDKMNFYGDADSMTPMKGNIKNLNKYIKDADRNGGAEYIYLFDERDQNWYMIDIYGDKELVPVFESVVTEGKHDEMLDKVADAVKNASNFMNVGIALKDVGIKYDFSTGMMPIYRLKKHPIVIVNKKYVDKGDREVGDIAIGVLESLTESLITEALEGRGQKDAMKGYAAIHKFMMAHPGFASKTVSDQTVAWTMKEALKAALIDANFHTEAKSVGKAINFANFQAPTVFVNELGGMPIQISKKMMMDKVYELATEITRGAKYNGFAIIEAVAMFFDDSFPKNSSASNLRDVLAKFMGEAVEANNLEQRINEGSAFNSARLKAIADDKDEFEFDGKTYPVKSVDKEDEELADDLVGEGNAFSTARLKAIEAGEEEFEFDGKTYPLTKVDKEDEELAADVVDESRYDDIKLKEFAEFIKKAEGKRVMLTTTEFDGTSKVEGRLQKSSSGYHKIDYMSFDFKDEMDTIKKGDGMIMGVRVGEFLKYNIGGKNGSQFLIEVL